MAKVRIDTIRLGSGHSLILGHKPDKVKLDQIAQTMEKQEMETTKFGLFDTSSPNYYTYYPEVTPEDFIPKSEDFIQPVFRMLSNISVSKGWKVIYFPAEVLKASMKKLVGQTLYADHEQITGNSMGSVAEVAWQEAYKSKEGFMIPAGINGVAKIDAKSNPRVARGIMMEPPSIHSASVQVNYMWEKSHPELSDEDFYSKMGSYDKDGKLVQQMVVDIISYGELSFVPHGADPFAQKVGKDGQIVNPAYARSVYQFSADTKIDDKQLIMFDFKDSIVDSSKFSNDDNTIPIKLNNNKQQENMKEHLKLLATLLGLGIELTEENFAEEVNKVIPGLVQAKADLGAVTKERDDLASEVSTLKSTITQKDTEVSTLKKSSDIGELALTEIRAEALRLYGIFAGDKKDNNIVEMIQKADYNTVKALEKQYASSVENKFQATCTKCGSHEFTRASASNGEEGGDTNSFTDKSNQEVVNKFVNRSRGFALSSNQE